jgi:hypothetical protein
MYYYGCSLCNYQSQDTKGINQHAKQGKHRKALDNWMLLHASGNDTMEQDHAIVNGNDESMLEQDYSMLNDDESQNEIVHKHNSSVPNPSFEQDHEHISDIDDMLDVLRATFKESSSTYLYLYMELFNDHNGKAALIADTLLSNKSLFDMVQENDEQIHFALLDLVMHSSTRQREKVVKLLRLILSRYSSSVTEDTLSHPPSVTIPLPTSLQELRTKYTRGRNSLWTSLPSVQVTEGLNKKGKATYGYLSVSESIGLYLAMGGTIASFDQMNLSEQRKYNKFKSHASWTDDSCVVFLNMWSDSFEPNSTKINRGKGKWLLTMTIDCGQHANNSLQRSNEGTFSETFPLGMCSSMDNLVQDEIIRNVINEVNELSTSPRLFVSSSEKKCLRVYASINIWLQDQIERRKRNYVMNGNSRPSSRWGYFIPRMDEVGTKIPACERCEEATKSNNWHYLNQPSCTSCYNWDVSRSEGSIALNHEYLTQTLNEATNIIRDENSTMSLNGLKEFCTSRGINKASALLIWDHVQNVKLKIEAAVRASAINPSVVEVRSLAKMNGPYYEPWRGPPLWTSLTHDFIHIVDAPMHCLFLGVVKTTMSYIFDFIKEHKIKTLFQNHMKKKLQPMLDEFKLSWFVLLDFSNSEPFNSVGWVSENYVSFSRIFLWYVSSLRLLGDTRTLYPLDEGKPVQTWSRIHLQMYVEQNNLSIALTSSNTSLKEAVKESLRSCSSSSTSSSSPESTSLQSISTNCTVENVIDAVGCLQNLLQVIMGPSRPNTRNLIEQSARLFLSSFHKLSCNLGKHDAYLNVWNLGSLLNMGLSTELFGHVSYRWEGGYQGEKTIQKCKEEKGILDSKYGCPKLLDTVLRRRSFGMLMNEEDHAQTTSGKKRIVTYTSIYEVLHRIRKHEAFSIFIHDETPYVAIKENHWHILKLEKVFHDDIGSFYAVTVNEDGVRVDQTELCLLNSVLPIFLLPNVHIIKEKNATVLFRLTGMSLFSNSNKVHYVIIHYKAIL